MFLNLDDDIIICDEIGPMELKSMEFINSVKNVLDVDKKIIIVMHQKLRHPLTDQFRNNASLLINVDLENREKVSKILLNRLLVE
ncbi:MAG: nucleoside-triphosphatase [Nitrososphaeraceae archaeon]